MVRLSSADPGKLQACVFGYALHERSDSRCEFGSIGLSAKELPNASCGVNDAQNYDVFFRFPVVNDVVIDRKASHPRSKVFTLASDPGGRSNKGNALSQIVNEPVSRFFRPLAKAM